MMRIRRVLFERTFHENGRPKYQAGRHFPLTDETRSQVLAGAARLTSVKVGPIGLIKHAIEEALACRALRIARAETLQAEVSHR
jgi:hypothetical protein